MAAYLASIDDEFTSDNTGLSIIIKSPDTWNAITDLKDPHYLIADFDLDGNSPNSTILLAKARQAHHAIIYRGMPGGVPDPNQASIPNPKNHQIQDSLEKAGYKEGRARSLAEKCDGNLNTLIRLLHNFSQTPEWAQGTAIAELAIAELMGSWNEKFEKDLEIVEKVSGNSYGEWIGKIRDVSFQPGTPLTYTDGAWKFDSRYEGWYALGPRLFDKHLENFRLVTVQVLRENDPKFELPPDQRFAANIYGKVTIVFS